MEGILPSGPSPVKGTAPLLSAPEDLKRMNPIFVQQIVLNQLNVGIAVTNQTTAAPTDPAETVSNAVVSLNGAEVFNIVGPVAGTVFEAQADAVIRAKDLRADRLAEIVLQQSDVLSFYGGLVQLNGISQPWALGLVSMVLKAAMSIVAQVKFALPVERPIELMNDAAPIIQTPQHSTMPSGHAAEGFAGAYVLSRLMGESDASFTTETNLYMRMAERIASNRTVAGVHFPMDSMAGSCLGLTLGRIYAAKLGIPGTPVDSDGFKIDTTEFGAQDFTAGAFATVANTPTGHTVGFDWLERTAPLALPGPLPVLDYLRTKAEEDLAP
jgi:hypothetical protein